MFANFTHKELEVTFKEIDSEILVIALIVLIVLAGVICKCCSKGEKKTKKCCCFGKNEDEEAPRSPSKQGVNSINPDNAPPTPKLRK